MGGPPRFSVVIPLHNKAAHIADTLESVRAQSLAPAEVIVVDDMSSDGGPDIVRAFEGLPIRLFHRDRPGPGGYAARNLAMEKAEGEWIAFLDADDMWSEDHLETLAQAHALHPDAGCLLTRYCDLYEDWRRIVEPTGDYLPGEGVALVDFPAFLRWWIAARESPMWTGAIAVRRDVIDRCGAFPDGRARRGGDKDLWLRIMRHTDMAYSRKVTASFLRDSMNKVTKTEATRALPALVPTALAMQEGASAAERALLDRLINVEIENYARHSFKAGGSTSMRLADYRPGASLRAKILLLLANHTPPGLLRGAYRLRAMVRKAG